MNQKIKDFLNTFVDLQKVLVMLLLITIGIVFRIKGLVDGNAFVDLLKNTAIAFFAVHATSHIVSAVGTYYSNQNTPNDPTDPSTPPPPPGVKL
jgi:hypothetical protein